MPSMWNVLSEVLVLLAAAFVLGLIFERLRQSAVVGYLLAGTLLGPHALHWIESGQVVRMVAELGVALLLFVIGLEFSLRRLLQIGPIALVGGTVQILLTILVTAGGCRALGTSWNTALAVGAIVALSSTACVLRVLADRAELDSMFGRSALGMLLLQDIAVVPLVLLATVLGGPATAQDIATELGRSAMLIAVLLVAFYLVSQYVLRPVLTGVAVRRNRELLILLAAVLALGAPWAAHALKLSPALGAFVAGLLLAESPFAVQIRVDVGAVRTLFVTLFFTSIGMLANPGWIARNWVSVAAVVGLIVAGKALLVAASAMLVRLRVRDALAAGICLAQVGEFSFVIAEVSLSNGVVHGDLYRLLISATLVTLLLTPYLVAAAPSIGRQVERLVPWTSRLAGHERPTGPAGLAARGHVVLVGFGPAGQRVGQLLARRGTPTTVVDLSPRNVEIARTIGLSAVVGDATNTHLLAHLHLAEAQAVAVTLPDLRTVLQVVRAAKAAAPAVPILARARYNRFARDIERAGADVLDEEVLIGKQLARRLAARLSQARP